MTLKEPKFAILGNRYRADKSDIIPAIIRTLLSRKLNVSVEQEFFNALPDACSQLLEGARVFEGFDSEADFVVSIGGDGTLLRSANSVGERCTPIIGVNAGRLGFLASVDTDNFGSVLDSIMEGDSTVDTLARVQVQTTRADGTTATECALNEIAILKRDNASMITIRASINGEYIVTYHADGLIVSTPTGSTAYSLSNGGPIIVPHTGTLCLTPVAPHSLNVRPIVLPDTAVITLEVESRSHNFLIAADGRSAKCEESQVLTIRRSPYDARIVKPKGMTYFSTLRHKMMWGADTRSKRNEEPQDSKGA